MKRIFLFLLSLSLCPVAIAIGRTGNKIADVDDGFESLVPYDYSNTHNMGLGNLRILQPAAPIHPMGNGLPGMVEILKVSTIYPEFEGVSRDDLIQKILGDGWGTASSYNPCISAFAFRSNTIVEGLVLWGQSKGILIRGMSTDDNWQAVNIIMTALKIQNGACDWK